MGRGRGTWLILMPLISFNEQNPAGNRARLFLRYFVAVVLASVPPGKPKGSPKKEFFSQHYREKVMIISDLFCL